MEFKDLVGEHMLSGIDTAREMGGYNKDEEIDVFRFILDGITYKAVEDPSDGYRSYCEELVVCDEGVSNTFPPQKVIGSMRENDQYGENDIIEFVDATTQKLVLAVGTHNLDDYYPSCWLEWNPENLAIN